MAQALTPPALRGHFYSSQLIRRCPSYKTCCRCTMCVEFNPHNQQCTICESRKNPVRKCECTDTTRHALIQLQKKIGRPMVDPNGKSGEVLMQTDFNQPNEELVKAIQQQNQIKPGR